MNRTIDAPEPMMMAVALQPFGIARIMTDIASGHHILSLSVEKNRIARAEYLAGKFGQKTLHWKPS